MNIADICSCGSCCYNGLYIAPPDTDPLQVNTGAWCFLGNPHESNTTPVSNSIRNQSTGQSQVVSRTFNYEWRFCSNSTAFAKLEELNTLKCGTADIMALRCDGQGEIFEDVTFTCQYSLPNSAPDSVQEIIIRMYATSCLCIDPTTHFDGLEITQDGSTFLYTAPKKLDCRTGQLAELKYAEANTGEWESTLKVNSFSIVPQDKTKVYVTGCVQQIGSGYTVSADVDDLEWLNGIETMLCECKQIDICAVFCDGSTAIVKNLNPSTIIRNMIFNVDETCGGSLTADNFDCDDPAVIQLTPPTQGICVDGGNAQTGTGTGLPLPAPVAEPEPVVA